jgi:hypothetical protein
VDDRSRRTVVSAPAPAGDYLVVATFDGTVHALVLAATTATPGPITACEPVVTPGNSGGCCSTQDDGKSALLLFALVIGFSRVRRPKR